MRVSKYFVRKTLPHETPPGVGDGEIFFITLCTKDRLASPLVQPGVPEKILNAACHYHEQGRWWVRLFLVMPDHVHGLVAVPPEEVLQNVVKSWKSYVKKVTGISWQMGYFDHRPRNLAAVQEKELYILNNPVRRKLVKDAEEWPWILRQRDLISQGEKTR